MANSHLVAVPILTAMRNLGAYATMHSFWAIAALLGGLVLVPEHGVMGMAIAFSLPIVVMEPCYLLVATRKLDMAFGDFVWPAIGGPALCLLPSGAAAWLLAELVPTTTFISLALCAVASSCLFLATYLSLFTTAAERSRAGQLTANLITRTIGVKK